MYIIEEVPVNFPFNGEFDHIKDEEWFKIKNVLTGKLSLGAYKNLETAEKVLKRKLND